jgi:hypothetical protein
MFVLFNYIIIKINNYNKLIKLNKKKIMMTCTKIMLANKNISIILLVNK